jgi:hypothetical protein
MNLDQNYLWIGNTTKEVLVPAWIVQFGAENHINTQNFTRLAIDLRTL